MAVQQNKRSKTKCRQRRAANRFKGIQSNACPHCGAARLPHRVCRGCGHYGDRLVLSQVVE